MEDTILTIHNTILWRTKGSYYKGMLTNDNRIKNIGLNKYITFCFKQHVNIENVSLDDIEFNEDPENDNLYVIIHGIDIYWESSTNWEKIIKNNINNGK